MKTKEEIEQLANDYGKSVGNTDGTTAFDFKLGYTQCQEDMADKKYTEEDMLKFANQYSSINNLHLKEHLKEFIQSLNKQD